MTACHFVYQGQLKFRNNLYLLLISEMIIFFPVNPIFK